MTAHDRSRFTTVRYGQPGALSECLATLPRMDASTYNPLINSDSRAVGSNRGLHLPKHWCKKQGVELAEDEVVVYEQEDGSLEVIPSSAD